jgi:hypothetical protein
VRHPLVGTAGHPDLHGAVRLRQRHLDPAHAGNELDAVDSAGTEVDELLRRTAHELDLPAHVAVELDVHSGCLTTATIGLVDDFGEYPVAAHRDAWQLGTAIRRRDAIEPVAQVGGPYRHRGRTAQHFERRGVPPIARAAGHVVRPGQTPLAPPVVPGGLRDRQRQRGEQDRHDHDRTGDDPRTC